jgi:hypothetical protein
MDESRNEKLNEIDELLAKTSEENRKKYKHYSIDADDFKSDDTDTLSDDIQDKPDEVSDTKYEDISSKPVIPESIPEEPVKEEKTDSDEAVKIIDQTSTSFTIEDSSSIITEAPSDSSTKAKKKKDPIKLNALQITLISVMAVITAWFIVFTVDHTLAAQGLTPMFSFQTQSYEDGSQSFKGAGYKIQFQFDANGKLTQKCVPFWKDGPNDEKFGTN